MNFTTFSFNSFPFFFSFFFFGQFNYINTILRGWDDMQVRTSICIHAIIDSIRCCKTNGFDNEKCLGAAFDEFPETTFRCFRQHYTFCSTIKIFALLWSWKFSWILQKQFTEGRTNNKFHTSFFFFFYNESRA